MNRISLGLGQRLSALLFVACISLIVGCGTRPTPSPSPIDEYAPKRLDTHLEALRKTYRYPGMAAVVFDKRKTLSVGVTGVRRQGGRAAITDGDRFHIGSCTKAMTATLVARLVERGVISFETTLTMLFPTLSIHPDYAEVTVEQLLRHEGGAHASLAVEGPHLWQILVDGLGKEPRTVRGAFVETLLKDPPPKPVGQFHYSNAGYILVGAALEALTGKDWTTLMAEEVFEPLAMNQCGFGAPATAGQEDQPWGHILTEESIQPIPPGPKADNPPALGPAGTVHCDLQSWTYFLRVHLGGGPKGYLKQETLDRLHTPSPGRKYAMGWLAPSPILVAHSGSNNMNYAETALLKHKGFGFIVVTNTGPAQIVSGQISRNVGTLLEATFTESKRDPE